MNYQNFFNEVVNWINEANDKAIKLGLESSEFWTWATRSIGEMCEKYDNNPLVIKQMVMLHEWLDDIYHNSR